MQLILEKISLAAGGLFLMVGAGCHIAKEVGWMVSKGALLCSDECRMMCKCPRPFVSRHAHLEMGPWELSHASLCAVSSMHGHLRFCCMVCAGVMCPPTRKDWKSYTFWLNWATFWVRPRPA